MTGKGIRTSRNACRFAGRAASAPCRSVATSSTSQAECGTPRHLETCPTVCVGGTVQEENRWQQEAASPH